MNAFLSSSGSAFLCEIKPTLKGGGYEIVSRTRVLAWRTERGVMLPVTLAGPAPLRAFAPNPPALTDGMAFVEFRNADGARRWWSAMKPEKEFSDAELGRAMVKLRDEGERIRDEYRALKTAQPA